jgi:predicted RNA-binding protein
VGWGPISRSRKPAVARNKGSFPGVAFPREAKRALLGKHRGPTTRISLVGGGGLGCTATGALNYVNLFSPETYEAFKRSNRSVTGFPQSRKNAAERVKPGDKLLCYLTRMSRWFGVLEVRDGPFIDHKPIFYPEDDPFVVRFAVSPLVVLEIDKAIPIHEDALWTKLSFTKAHDRSALSWVGKIRASLVQINEPDGELIEELLRKQVNGGISYDVDLQEYAKLIGHPVRRADRTVSVSIPGDPEDPIKPSAESEQEVRESIRVQTLIATIGSQMGFSIWIPRADRGRVLQEAPTIEKFVLDRLPLNYDDVTLKTIEQIDVLWLRGRSIVRAFQVEHSTSIYSGILRMADLLALQPNMDIKLHIVAPASKREKVFQEIRRPVFSLLERGPLFQSCTYLSYDSLKKMSELEHLGHMSDRVVDEYAEEDE